MRWIIVFEIRNTQVAVAKEWDFKSGMHAIIYGMPLNGKILRATQTFTDELARDIEFAKVDERKATAFMEQAEKKIDTEQSADFLKSVFGKTKIHRN